MADNKKSGLDATSDQLRQQQTVESGMDEIHIQVESALNKLAMSFEQNDKRSVRQTQNQLKGLESKLLERTDVQSKEYLQLVSANLSQTANSVSLASRASETALSRIQSSLPTRDTFLAALTTANPIVGLSASLATNSLASLSESRKMRRLEHKQQGKNLKAELERIKESKAIAPASEPSNVLEPEIVDIEPITSNLEKVQDPLNDIVAVNEKILERLDDSVDIAKQNELEEDRNAAIARREDIREGNIVPKDDAEKVGDEKDTGLLGSLGGFFSSFAASITGFLAGGAGLIGGLGLAFAGFYAAYQIIEGFFNAGEIFGKDSVTFIERISGGLAGLLGGFLDLFEGVFSFFGVELDLKGDEITQTVAYFLRDMITGIVDFFTGIGQGVLMIFTDPEQGFNKIKDTFVETFDKVLDSIVAGFEFIQDAIAEPIERVESAVSGMFDFMTDAINDMIQSAAQLAVDILPDIVTPDSLKDVAEYGLFEKQISPSSTMPENIDRVEQNIKQRERESNVAATAAQVINAPSVNSRNENVQVVGGVLNANANDGDFGTSRWF